jgi:hypothetical protein
VFKLRKENLDYVLRFKTTDDLTAETKSYKTTKKEAVFSRAPEGWNVISREIRSIEKRNILKKRTPKRLQQ